ncbi:DNA glycosylase [Athelia psychrophila]|uniref:DNA glycosylase n=1 Tax=Athelia psychrophila TaxID=1759441 RepID=A0A166VGS5_9AGAM|nr:DNA glycosylase [Fibularhizoctonia sp. CBS 109695]
MIRLPCLILSHDFTERVRDDTWKLLIAVMFLNKTNGRVAVPMFWEVLRRWPNAILLSIADEEELTTLIRPLGLQAARAARLIKLSKLFINEPPSPNILHCSRAKIDALSYPPTPISHFPGCGAYALDSYRIFHVGPCNGPSEWKSVMPGDKELIRYLRWKWAFEQNKIWEPTAGVVGSVNEEYLRALPGLLRE